MIMMMVLAKSKRFLPPSKTITLSATSSFLIELQDWIFSHDDDDDEDYYHDQVDHHDDVDKVEMISMNVIIVGAIDHES